MQLAAGELGLEWFLPPVAVAFAGPDDAPGEPIRADSPNLHGRTRLTCRLCGECNVGCNYGSKNTLDFNYLSLASLRHGAAIRTRCEVKTFAPPAGSSSRPAASGRRTFCSRTVPRSRRSAIASGHASAGTATS